jgi:CBS-domain-containing membrane protein
MKKNTLHAFLHFMGIGPEGSISHAERLVSALGGFFGIFGIFVISRQFLSEADAVLIVASMGASAVLLFAVPHGKLSQPWALLGGHVISACIGVTIAALVGNIYLAAGLAVGLAIGAMHYLRCIHPPGGATALIAVIGGPSVSALGYQFVITPILLNAVIIFIIGILFNYLFHWRRYPVSLMSHSEPGYEKPKHDQAGAINLSMFNDGDLKYAARKMDLVLDVTHEDLMRLFALANRHAMGRFVKPEHLKREHYYSNGLYGKLWSVRQIIDESGDMVTYRVAAGADRRHQGTCSREDFSKWARFEVSHQNEQWQRIEKIEE